MMLCLVQVVPPHIYYVSEFPNFLNKCLILRKLLYEICVVCSTFGEKWSVPMWKASGPSTAVWEQWPCAWVLPREEVSLRWCMFAESEEEKGCDQCVVCVASLWMVFREGASGKLLVFLKDQAVNVFGFVLWMVGKSKNYFTKCLFWILWDVCVFIYVFFNFKFVRLLLRFLQE